MNATTAPSSHQPVIDKTEAAAPGEVAVVARATELPARWRTGHWVADTAPHEQTQVRRGPGTYVWLDGAFFARRR